MSPPSIDIIKHFVVLVYFLTDVTFKWRLLCLEITLCQKKLVVRISTTFWYRNKIKYLLQRTCEVDHVYYDEKNVNK